VMHGSTTSFLSSGDRICLVDFGQECTGQYIYDRKTYRLYINPSGKFIIGGAQGDAGLTRRTGLTG